MATYSFNEIMKIMRGEAKEIALARNENIYNCKPAWKYQYSGSCAYMAKSMAIIILSCIGDIKYVQWWAKLPMSNMSNVIT